MLEVPAPALSHGFGGDTDDMVSSVCLQTALTTSAALILSVAEEGFVDFDGGDKVAPRWAWVGGVAPEKDNRQSLERLDKDAVSYLAE